MSSGMQTIHTNEHDEYVKTLVKQISPIYDSISTHQTLEKKRRNKKKIVGEVDIVARKGDEIHLYEVKCSYRIVKAKKQLLKLKKSKAFKKFKTTCFFYCGEGHQLVEVC